MKQICMLCNEPQLLRKSHIIPRAIYKRRKRKGSPQLVGIKLDKKSLPNIANYNPKERLFCASCENDVLNKKYECHVDKIFTAKCKFVKTDSHVIFKDLNFNTVYLYMLSILWRASISTLKEFKSVNLGDCFNEVIRNCIYKETLKIKEGITIDQFFKLKIYRILDKEKQLDDRVFKDLILYPNVRCGNDKSEGLDYFFMMEGFFVVITITKKNSIDTDKHNPLEVPFCDFRDIPFLRYSFAGLVYKAQKYGEF